MSERRPQPDLDRVRDALRDRDQRREDAQNEGENGTPPPDEDEQDDED